MEVDQSPSYDEVDGIRLKGNRVDFRLDDSKKTGKLQLYHMMSPAQKLQMWIVTACSAVTVLVQVVGILGHAAVTMESRSNCTFLYGRGA